MTQQQDYEGLLETLRQIPVKDVVKPIIPPDVFAQEGENLARWAENDKENLEAAGLDWALVETLPARAGALRQAESIWLVERYQRQESQARWSESAPKAYDLRVEIMHAFRYAYGDHPEILGRIRAIDKGTGHANMIQDLSSLAMLGRKNPAPLEAIRFDMALLDEAAAMAKEIAQILAESIAETVYVEAKDIRDRAYTHLKQAVTAVRECGQYVFWRDPARAAGYASDYLRTHRSEPRPETPEEDNPDGLKAAA